MKKTLLFLCGTCLVAAASAQSQKLVSIVADDEMESASFTYNEQNLLTKYLHIEEYVDGISYFDTLTYNELGQIVEDATHQNMDFSPNQADWRLVTKCTYTYNEQGLVATRDNFNSFGGQLEQSAHIWYDYDEQGRIVKENQAWAYNPTEPFMIIEYIYDEAGRLVQKLESSSDWYGNFSESGMLENTYNEQNQLVSSKYYYLGFGDPWLAEDNEYSYDECGNVIKAETLSESGHVNSRYVYTYDTSVEASDVLLPESHEYQVHHNFGINNRRATEEVWVTNDWDEDLFLAYTLCYEYAPNQGVSLVRVSESARMFFDADAKVLNIMSGNGAAAVRVMNQNGQTMMLAHVQDGHADLSGLSAGIYLLSVKCPGMSAQHQKIVIR